MLPQVRIRSFRLLPALYQFSKLPLKKPILYVPIAVKNMNYKFIFFLGGSLFFSLLIGCKGENKPQKAAADATDKALATAYDETLYFLEVQPLLTENMTPEDSLKTVNGVVQKWLRDRAMLHVVADRVQATPEIEALVENYRKSLLLHQYRLEKEGEKPDTAISAEQFKAAYDTLGAALANNETMLLADFVAIPAVWKDMATFTKLWANAAETSALTEFCKKNADGFFVNTWLSYEDLAAKLPKNALPESGLAANKTWIIKKSDTHYYIRCREIQKKGDRASFEAAKTRLRAVIMQQRKTQNYTRLVEEAYQTELKARRIELK